MLKTDNWLFKLILIFNILCILVCDIASVKDIIDPASTPFMQVGGACSIVALLAALYYILMGYSKNASAYYKLYGALYALSALVSIFNVSHNNQATVYTTVLSALVFAFVLVMTLSRDLGKRNSFIICGLTFACAAIQVVLGFVDIPATNEEKPLIIIRLVAGVVMASMLGVMTFAKYVDKAQRHTK